MEKLFAAIAVLSLLMVITFLGAIGFVALHFLAKAW